jgi:tRNA modification GTPase
VHLDLAGYPVTLLDTAGIRDSNDPVEQEGVRRARARAAMADLVLWVTDASADGGAGGEAAAQVPNTELWWLRNKIDLAQGGPGRNESRCENGINRSFAISAVAGTGMDNLIKALVAFAQAYFAATETTLITRARHRQALQETVAALNRALAQGNHGREELIAEELRSAATMLGRLTGRVDVEDILDVIFREFCIGK